MRFFRHPVYYDVITIFIRKILFIDRVEPKKGQKIQCYITVLLLEVKCKHDWYKVAHDSESHNVACLVIFFVESCQQSQSDSFILSISCRIALLNSL